MDVTATTPVLPAFAELVLGGMVLGSFGTVAAGICLMLRLRRRAG